MTNNSYTGTSWSYSSLTFFFSLGKFLFARGRGGMKYGEKFSNIIINKRVSDRVTEIICQFRQI